jgi:pyruvate/2-oxoglutarate/acetoin dehydrogenase E1 component
MILDARKISSTDLKIIAASAAQTQARIIVKHPSVLNSTDMKAIAANGMGCVVFDFCET